MDWQAACRLPGPQGLRQGAERWAAEVCRRTWPAGPARLAAALCDCRGGPRPERCRDDDVTAARGGGPFGEMRLLPSGRLTATEEVGRCSRYARSAAFRSS